MNNDTNLGDPFGGTKTSILTKLLEGSFAEMMKQVYTSLPGHLVSFDPVTQLCHVQIGLKTELKDGSRIDPAPLIEVPVQFWGGTGGTLECAMEPGVEGAVFFSQECIDSWVEQGGIAIKPEMRRHDQNDAYFIPGIRSKPNAISGFINEGIRLRNNAGTSYLWIHEDGSVEIGGTQLIVNCPSLFNADVDTMAALRNFLHDVGYLHKHSGVQSGNGISGPVTP